MQISNPFKKEEPKQASAFVMSFYITIMVLALVSLLAGYASGMGTIYKNNKGQHCIDPWNGSATKCYSYNASDLLFDKQTIEFEKEINEARAVVEASKVSKTQQLADKLKEDIATVKHYAKALSDADFVEPTP